MLNLCVFTGRLTADPELKTTEDQKQFVNFSIAVGRNYKDKNGEYPADFFECVAWRNIAEFITNHFKKGSMITVSGAFETNKYTDKNGNNRTAYKLQVNRAFFGDSGKSTEENAQSANKPASNVADSVSDFTETDDDLPF